MSKKRKKNEKRQISLFLKEFRKGSTLLSFLKSFMEELDHKEVKDYKQYFYHYLGAEISFNSMLYSLAKDLKFKDFKYIIYRRYIETYAIYLFSKHFASLNYELFYLINTKCKYLSKRAENRLRHELCLYKKNNLKDILLKNKLYYLTGTDSLIISEFSYQNIINLSNNFHDLHLSIDGHYFFLNEDKVNLGLLYSYLGLFLHDSIVKDDDLFMFDILQNSIESIIKTIHKELYDIGPRHIKRMDPFNFLYFNEDLYQRKQDIIHDNFDDLFDSFNDEEETFILDAIRLLYEFLININSLFSLGNSDAIILLFKTFIERLSNYIYLLDLPLKEAYIRNKNYYICNMANTAKYIEGFDKTELYSSLNNAYENYLENHKLNKIKLNKIDFINLILAQPSYVIYFKILTHLARVNLLLDKLDLDNKETIINIYHKSVLLSHSDGFSLSNLLEIESIEDVKEIIYFINKLVKYIFIKLKEIIKENNIKGEELLIKISRLETSFDIYLIYIQNEFKNIFKEE